MSKGSKAYKQVTESVVEEYFGGMLYNTEPTLLGRVQAIERYLGIHVEAGQIEFETVAVKDRQTKKRRR